MATRAARTAVTAATALAVVVATGAFAPAPDPDPSGSASARVGLAGVTVEVPTDWVVVDLAADPTACVQFDVHAIYLGEPGTAQQCPTVLTGRTEALLVQPLPAELPFGVVELVPGAAPEVSAAQRLAGEVVGRVAGTAVLVTAGFASDPASVASILATLQVEAAEPAGAATADLAVTATPTPIDRSFTWHYGRGFDACTAPALSTMQAWLSSPYRSVGIYIGGAARGCNQANLTPSWIRSIAAIGWKAQPIYVGLQAPCSSFSARITYGQEWTQGRDAALDAIARARALGIGAGSDIYYDMESYPRSPDCSGSVRAYLSSWTSTLQYNGYSSGVYSSASTGIADLASGSAQPGFVAPDKIWIARWNGVPDVYAHDAYVADSQWAPYRRMQQYQGGHVETWGGVSINIDSNVLDTDPNRGSPTGQVDSISGRPSALVAAGWAVDPETSGPIIIQVYVDGVFAGMDWADESRPDVGAAFPALGGNHGYHLTVPATAGRHSVCVYAVNVGPGTSTGLGCRVGTALSSDPFGQVDTTTATPGTVRATGWAIDPDGPAPLIVQAYVDGVFAGMDWADEARADIGAAFPAAGPGHGYSLTFPASPGRHSVCLYAVNTGPGASVALGCRTVDVPTHNPGGQVDSVTASAGQVTARGWALDPDTTGPVIVQMYLDGGANTMAWANLSRPDIGAAFPAAGSAHGFSLTMPAGRGAHTVCVYAVNVGPGSAVGLGCHVVSVG